MKRATRLEPAPPYAALELHRDQVRVGHRTPRRPGALSRDRFETAADWERRAIEAPVVGLGRAAAKIGRASLTGKSPRTRHGRWRRDLEYLELILAEAIKTLPQADLAKYGDMVAAWRSIEPVGTLGRYLALLTRKRGESHEPAR